MKGRRDYSKKFCECGCGELINAFTYGEPWRARKFKNGHNGRLMTMQKHWAWKGGRKIDRKGYILILAPNNRHSDMNGYAREHILIYEEYHKCSILSQWVDVHHKNGIKQDNRIENLTLQNHIEHSDSHRDPKTGRFM